MRTLFKHPRRVWQFILVFVRFYVLPRLPFRHEPSPSGPVRLRMAFETLGGAWIKLGQMLAMRFDLLPAAYCDELFKLLNQVQPFPYRQVREIVRQELGDVPEAIFGDFTRRVVRGRLDRTGAPGHAARRHAGWPSRSSDRASTRRCRPTST